MVLINVVHRLKNSEPEPEPEPSEPRLKKVWALDWAWIQNLEPEPWAWTLEVSLILSLKF